MILARLALKDFRNFTSSEIGLGPGLSVIEGRNAQGKSNLLEAIFFFGALHPLRARSARDLVRFGAGGFSLQGWLGEDARGCTVIGDGQRRQLSVAGAAATAGRWPATALRPVAFLPEDVDLASEAGEMRRRYLDRLAAILASGHGAALAAARRILGQRAHALAQGDGAELWEEPLAQAYAPVARGRRAATAALRGMLPAMAAEYGEASPAEVAYRPTVLPLAEPLELADGLRVIRAALREGREREARAGLCLIGPHRDEVQFLLGGEDVRRFASRGAQRTLALALRTAEAEIVRGHAGSEPLLLVDDVLPELDEERQRRVVARALAGPQALLAAAEVPRALARADAARRYRVEGGRVLAMARSCHPG